MTHKQARRKLGSRSVRRAGISSVRLRSGGTRATTKEKVAVAVRRLIAADSTGASQVQVAIKGGHGWVGR